jgi:tetratricopeptide (TPR) repeat protein
MVHQQMAWSLCENGNLEESIEEIKRLIENNPEEGYNYYMMGHVLSCKGEYDSAIKEYNRAIELDPKNPAYHFLLGTILSKKGQFGSASEEYELAAKLNPPVLLAKEIYERKTKTEKRIGLFYKFRRWFKK